jgi:peptidoglycan/LPS O-acetylase OafA/YrhL
VKSPHDLSEYWIDRSVRIGPVLIAATAFSTILQHMAPLFGCVDSHAIILGNALGFQNFLVKPLCNNLPLWSISNEVAYYFAFPVLIAAFSRAFSVWLAISSLCVILICILSLSLAPLDDTNIVFDFPFWLIGAALWFVPGNLPRSRTLALLMVAGALLFGRLESGKNHFWLRDLLLATSFSYLLVSFLDRPIARSGVGATVAGYVASCSRWFADLSFSLYVTHYPLIRLYIYFVLNSGHQQVPYTGITPRILLEFMGLGAFCILVAFGFSLLFERPRRSFKRTILRSLRISGTSPAA